jgi:predicted Zn-dependent peptidase
MLKKILAFFSLLIFLNSAADPARYRGASFKKLSNGVSVIFVNTAESDSLLIMLCISSGSGDEIDKRGVANLLGYMFEKKLKEKAAADSLQYGSESNSYVGHDQSVYYFYGKVENLKGFIRNLGTIFSNFAFSTEDFGDGKRVVEQQIVEDGRIDKNFVRRESRKSLYWHSNLGTETSGDLDGLKTISEEDIRDFKNKNYANNRVTIIIAGNVDKDQAIEEIVKYFGKAKTESKIDRLQEPPHHGSTARITKYSSQVRVPFIEMYWRIPNYRNQKNEALAAEIFINYLQEALQKNLIDDQKIISSMSFSYSFWNYDYGDFCITIAAKKSSDVRDVIAAVLSEIKCLAAEGITEEQAKKAAKKLAASSNVFYFDADVFEFVDWVSKRMGSGYDFDFLKSYRDFVNKFNLD